MAGLSVSKFTDGVVVVTGIGLMGMKADVAGTGCGEVIDVSIGRKSFGGGACGAVGAAVVPGSSMGRNSDGAGARVVDVTAAPSMGRNAVGGGAPTAVVSSGGPLSQ